MEVGLHFSRGHIKLPAGQLLSLRAAAELRHSSDQGPSPCGRRPAQPEEAARVRLQRDGRLLGVREGTRVVVHSQRTAVGPVRRASSVLLELHFLDQVLQAVPVPKHESGPAEAEVGRRAARERCVSSYFFLFQSNLWIVCLF